MSVRTCQTVTWSSHDSTTLATPGGGAGELMVLSRGFADSAATFYLRGLRYGYKHSRNTLTCTRHGWHLYEVVVLLFHNDHRRKLRRESEQVSKFIEQDARRICSVQGSICHVNIYVTNLRKYSHKLIVV